MLDRGPTELAAHGERGIDLFLRSDDDGQKRARYRCIATLTPADGLLVLFEPRPANAADRLRALALALLADPRLSQPMTLGDPTGWPRAAVGDDPLRLFVYLDFFRAWQVADLAAQRLNATRPDTLTDDPDRFAAAVAPVFDFNRLGIATTVARTLQPVIAGRLGQQGDAVSGPAGRRADRWGYGLRMLGDLCLRAAEPVLALACFETAVSAGDNPHRRRRCIEAAHAAGDAATLARHAAAFRTRWAMPPDLAALAAGASA